MIGGPNLENSYWKYIDLNQKAPVLGSVTSSAVLS